MQRVKLHPIRGRYPQQVHFFNIMYFIMMTMATLTAWLELDKKLSCVIFLFLKTFPFCGMLYPITLRAWLLLFQFEIMRDLMRQEDRVGPDLQVAATTKQQQSRARLVFRPGWYLRNRHLMSPKFVRRTTIVMTVFLLVGCISAVPLSITHGSASCSEANALTLMMFVSSLIIIVIEFLVLAVVACKLSRHSQDGFGVKAELRALVRARPPLSHSLASLLAHAHAHSP